MNCHPFACCRNLKEIKVSAEHPYLATIDGVLFSKPDKRLICCPEALSTTVYDIPKGIKIIGDSSFREYSSLTSVTIPDSMTSIGDYAFFGCESLTGITIPDSVISIGDRAFEKCPNLTITVPRDSYALQYCTDKDIKYMYTDSLDWLNN